MKYLLAIYAEERDQNGAPPEQMEAVQDAFVIALERWPDRGIPDNPGAWIVTAARNRAIDRIRRVRTLERKHDLLAALQALGGEEEENDVGAVPDDRLRLIFTCCH